MVPIVLREDPPLCKKTGGLFMYLPPTLKKKWFLVCIAPTLSGVEIKKKDSNLLVPFLQQYNLHAHQI